MSKTWTILEVLNWTKDRFAQAGVASARLDAELLLVDVLKLDRIQLYTQFDKPLADEELTGYRERIRRRLDGEPVAYILGHKEFWSIDLAVDARVLIPRPDTELLVEIGLEAARERGSTGSILDVCTGSGAVAIALAVELDLARVVATELSPEAAALARQNVSSNGVAVDVREGDLFEPVAGESFDVVVSNPPYVRSGELETLAREVQKEPRLALDGGADGLDVIRRLVAAAPQHVVAGGVLAIEHGYDQGQAVRELIDATNQFFPAGTRKDLAGHPRVTLATRR